MVEEQKNELIFYNAHVSPWGRMCLVALESLTDVDYKVVEIDMKKGQHKSPEYLAKFPTGKIPALEHGELNLYESGAVYRYLFDITKNSPLYPKDDLVLQGKIDVAVEYMRNNLFEPVEKIMGEKCYKFLFAPSIEEAKECKTNQDIIKEEGAKYATIFKNLKDHFFKDSIYMIGKELSFADVVLYVVWSHFHQFHNHKEYLKQFDKKWVKAVLKNKAIAKVEAQRAEHFIPILDMLSELNGDGKKKKSKKDDKKKKKKSKKDDKKKDDKKKTNNKKDDKKKKNKTDDKSGNKKKKKKGSFGKTLGFGTILIAVIGGVFKFAK